MNPLILITNDDGVDARGIAALRDIATSFGQVVVMAPQTNASGTAHSFTGVRPLKVTTIRESAACSVYACDGTPVDCVKICSEHFCPRTPDLVLSGINHGSNASINILYSGTMGAVLEASVCGLNAIGFSLLDQRADADFAAAEPFIRQIIATALRNGLPHKVSLNVNIPASDIKGVKVCRQSDARWVDCYEKTVDPQGGSCYTMYGHFECHDKTPDTDLWALENGYVSVVPISTDFTATKHLENIRTHYERMV